MADEAQSNPRSLNETPLISEIITDIQNNSVTFSHNATDPDGSIQTVYWEFGDGETSSEASPTHNYSSDGTYLVMCRVTDNDGSRNSRWKYVTVGGVAISVAALHANTVSKLVSCIPLNNSVSFTMRLNKSGNYSLYVYNTKGQQLWEHYGNKGNAGYFKAHWNCDDPNYQIGNKVYIAKLIHNGKHSVMKFTVAR
jgi:hypothetical protein